MLPPFLFCRLERTLCYGCLLVHEVHRAIALGEHALVGRA
jgi:hypothetical protein